MHVQWREVVLVARRRTDGNEIQDSHLIYIDGITKETIHKYLIMLTNLGCMDRECVSNRHQFIDYLPFRVALVRLQQLQERMHAGRNLFQFE